MSADVFKEIEDTFGFVPNFFRYQAEADPEWCALNWSRFKKIMLEGNLDRKTKEIIAVTVSAVKNCHYCSATHKGALKMLGVTDSEITEILKVVELFESFTRIADTLEVLCDVHH